jgi:hypothetical protein
MGGIENGFHGIEAMPFLAFGDVFLGELHIAEDRAGIGPLLEQVVVLEEMIVAEGACASPASASPWCFPPSDR